MISVLTSFFGLISDNLPLEKDLGVEARMWVGRFSGVWGGV